MFGVILRPINQPKEFDFKKDNQSVAEQTFISDSMVEMGINQQHATAWTDPSLGELVSDGWTVAAKFLDMKGVGWSILWPCGVYFHWVAGRVAPVINPLVIRRGRGGIGGDSAVPRPRPRFSSEKFGLPGKGMCR